jgi:hypothetical protein
LTESRFGKTKFGFPIEIRREQPSTPAHAARTPHPARAVCSSTHPDVHHPRPASTLPPTPPPAPRTPTRRCCSRPKHRPRRCRAPLRPRRHRARLKARHPRPPDPGPRTPPPQRRRASARHRTVPRPIAWDARGSIVSGATATRPRAAKPSRRSDQRPRSLPPRPRAVPSPCRARPQSSADRHPPPPSFYSPRRGITGGGSGYVALLAHAG